MFAQFLDKIREKSTFLALGDSVISDCFPGPGLGAASLLFQNDDRTYPQWKERDLRHRYRNLVRVGVTRTGYCLEDIVAQLPDLRGVAEVGLLSVGGNDFLREMPRLPQGWFDGFSRAYGSLLQRLRPLAKRWLICNLYDPSEGTGELPGRQAKGLAPLPELPELLARLNGVIASHAGDDLVDVYRWFQGHGWGTEEVWFQMDIEPSRRGADKLRELLWRKVDS